MEILAPAGNREALERAEAAGADAVYLGYAAFSARAGAGNFDRQALEEAIRFAHLRHMRVHVTVNTLIKDDELEQAAEVLRMLRELRADAVLVQDLGVLRMIRALCPDLAVHASTQMAIHNRTGAAWCRRMGMRRVVLARECSLEEIRRCCAEDIEIEVFGHGAQCVAVSGLCLFSSMAGPRSGNRGRCAQPCRMLYEYRGRTGAWLSPRDVCLRDDMPALREAGVASLKLEGRLKRPEYVAVVTEAYRRGEDTLEAGRFETAGKAEREGLRQIFNRGGFMRGYAFGCEDAGVIYPERVSHEGIALGTVLRADGKMARIRTERLLRDGDGLQIRHGREAYDLIYAGKDTPAGGEALLRLREDARVRAGDAVFRLTDSEQMRRARAMDGRRVRADMTLRAMPGEPMALTATDGESVVRVTGETVQAARTRPALPEEIIRGLERTGDTVFEPGKIRAETENAFVSASQVNRLRREALERLAEERAERFAPAPGRAGEMPECVLPEGEVPPMAEVRTPEQAEAARKEGLRLVFAPEDYREGALRETLEAMRPGDWLRLPDVCEEETLQMLLRLTEEYRDKLGGVVLGTVGQLGAAWPVPYGAGSGIPVMNRQAAALLFEAGCAFVTASAELTGRELETLTAGRPPVAVTVYGRTRLMLLHHCPARTALGLSTGRRDCAMCDEGHPDALRGSTLDDARGYRFPLLRQRLPEGCLVQLMNTLPTDWLDHGEVRNPVICLTDESGEETAGILRAMKAGRKSGAPSTAGHWKRPVE